MSQLNKQLKIVAIEYEISSQMCIQSDSLTAIKQTYMTHTLLSTKIRLKQLSLVYNTRDVLGKM